MTQKPMKIKLPVREELRFAPLCLQTTIWRCGKKSPRQKIRPSLCCASLGRGKMEFRGKHNSTQDRACLLANGFPFLVKLYWPGRQAIGRSPHPSYADSPPVVSLATASSTTTKSSSNWNKKRKESSLRCPILDHSDSRTLCSKDTWHCYHQSQILKLGCVRKRSRSEGL